MAVACTPGWAWPGSRTTSSPSASTRSWSVACSVRAIARAPSGSPRWRSGRAMPSANSESPPRAPGRRRAARSCRSCGRAARARGSSTSPSAIASPSCSGGRVGVGDAALERRAGQAQRRARRVGQRTGAREVIGVQVGVDDVGDRRAELGRELDVERRRRAPGRRRALARPRRRRRTGSRGRAAGPGAPSSPGIPRSTGRACSGADPAAHAALEDHGVDARARAERLRHALRGDPAVADDGDRRRPGRGRVAAGSASTAAAGTWRAVDARRLDRPRPRRRGRRAR